MSRKYRGRLLLCIGLLLMFIAAALSALYDAQDAQAGENARRLAGLLREDMERAQVPPANPLPQAQVAGRAVLGLLKIPVLKLELPVLRDWSYEGLRLSPCRYTGSAAAGNLIVLGHNYRSHFTPLKKLKAGDAVEFCDVSGRVYAYRVAQTEKLHKRELDALISTDFPLTLFTCTNDGLYRFTVRCRLEAIRPFQKSKSDVHKHET